MSPKGGVGKTTLTANLASTLAGLQTSSQRVLAIDLDPQNALRFHHRIHFSDKRGLVPAALNGTPLEQALYQGPYRVDCLPYGATTESQRQSFEAELARKPTWLRDALDGLNRQTVLVDTPPGPTIYMRQALAAADLVLVVLLADAASFATLEAMRRYVDDYCPPDQPRPPMNYVVNQVDSTKMLNRDVVVVLRSSLRNRAQLWSVHYDTAVEEARACHQPVSVYNPRSTAAQDLGGLAQWLTTR